MVQKIINKIKYPLEMVAALFAAGCVKRAGNALTWLASNTPKHLLLKLILTLGIMYLIAWFTLDYATGAPMQQTKSATATWNANTEPDLDGYKIYYGTSSRNYTQKFDIGHQTQVLVNELEVGKTYYFAVTAYDTSGNESVFSDEVSLLIAPDADTTPPAKPLNFRVFIDAENGTVTVEVGEKK